MAKNACYMQVVVVDDARSGVKDGRQWQMQDVKAILLDEDGVMVDVGAYTVSKEELGKMGAGIYAPRFAIGVGNGEKTKGKVIPVFAGWTAMTKGAKGFAPAAVPASKEA